jgi:hypothetical protein
LIHLGDEAWRVEEVGGRAVKRKIWWELGVKQSSSPVRRKPMHALGDSACHWTFA